MVRFHLGMIFKMEFVPKIICEARENSPEVICPPNRARTPGTRNYYQVSIDRILHHRNYTTVLVTICPKYHLLGVFVLQELGMILGMGTPFGGVTYLLQIKV